MTRPLKVFVAGHRGMVGSAIARTLSRSSGVTLVTRTHAELDLTDQAQVRRFFDDERPDQVYLAAAKVGGIHANDTYPADFISQNLSIQSNVIDSAFRSGVRKLLFLGSSCIYPRSAEQPMREDALLAGPLEPTNEPYAIAKIAGIKLCESYNRQYAAQGIDYRSAMPTNLYGPGDNYHPLDSHVIPGLLRRVHEAKAAGASAVQIWGTGSAMREFLFVDDLAGACVHIMNLDRVVYAACTSSRLTHVNVGAGEELSIAELAQIICRVVGYDGRLEFDRSRPDGTPRKLMDSGKLRALGWRPTVSLEVGLRVAYSDFLRNHSPTLADTTT